MASRPETLELRQLHEDQADADECRPGGQDGTERGTHPAVRVVQVLRRPDPGRHGMPGQAEYRTQAAAGVVKQGTDFLAIAGPPGTRIQQQRSTREPCLPVPE